MYCYDQRTKWDAPWSQKAVFLLPGYLNYLDYQIIHKYFSIWRFVVAWTAGEIITHGHPIPLILNTV